MVDKRFALLPAAGLKWNGTDAYIAHDIVEGDLLEYDDSNKKYVKWDATSGKHPVAIATEDFANGQTPAYIKAVIAGEVFEDEINDTLDETVKFHLRDFGIYVVEREVY